MIHGHKLHFYEWASTRKTLSSVIADNKGADQPVHLRSLVSAFGIRLLESIVSKLGTRKFSIFKLFSLAEGTSLSLALSELSLRGP